MKRKQKTEENNMHMNARIFSLIACFLIINIHAFSQRSPQIDLKIKKSEFITESEEGFEEAWKNIKTGNSFFQEGIGTYSIAREYYLKAHQYNSEHPVLNYLIGICYLYTDNKYEALAYMRKAYDKYPDLDPEINYYLGRAYHLVLEFDRAIEHYKDYREKAVALGDVNGAIEVDKRIIECQNGKELVPEPLRVIITNMGDSINSVYDDYYPVLINNDSLMYFTSRREHEKRNKRNPYDNKFHEDIYYSYINDDGVWMGAEPLTTKINKQDNNALAGVSPDGKSLYIYDGNVKGGDIYRSDYNKEKNIWKKPKPISKKLRSDDAEGSVFLTKNSDTIYFISANKETSEGGKDIFYSVKNDKGKWMEPKNLGALINTPHDEEGVFLTEDGRVMYFSSKGHNSMGGFDIFYTYKLKDGTWADPVNVGYPVNTPDDELFFHLRRNGKYAYFTTIREGGIGAKDIYKITFLGAEKELMLSTEDIMIASLADTNKTGFFEMPAELSIELSYYLTGKIIDKETGEPLMGKLEFIDIDNSQVIATSISVDSGKYTVKFQEPKQYGVEIMVKDYLFFLDVIDMSAASGDSATVRNFELERIKVGAKVVLENIYFETGKAILKEESHPQLNQIIQFLENNESLRLEISGHTDNTGSLKVNARLSKDRAKAVVDYLIANGIDQSRLEWEGYAFSQPIAPNDTAEGRARNRRVEFKILSK